MGDEKTPVNPASAPLTADAVQRMIHDTVTAALKPVTESLGKLSAGVGQHAAPAVNGPAEVRSRFINDMMKDVPETYRQSMPATSDLAELAAAEQRIRGVYRKDLDAAGFKPPDVSGAPPAGSLTPAQVPGPVGSSVQNIAQGLRDAGGRGGDPNREAR